MSVAYVLVSVVSGAVLLKWCVPVSSRDRSFWPNRSDPRKKNGQSLCLQAISFTSEDLRYEVANHINRQRSTLQYFANLSIFKCKSNLFIMGKKRYMNNRLKHRTYGIVQLHC